MRIALTKWQVQLLEGTFKQAKIEEDEGKPGAIVAQISPDTTGGAFMNIELLNSTTTLKIQKAMGIPQGKIFSCDSGVVVFVEPKK